MKVKLSDFIADVLVKNNINTVFTVTGGGAMHLNDSFGKHSDLKCYYNHHEQACAMAAEGYARVSGIPALVCVTTGPGGTNALTGVLGAWLDSIPMIVISGQVKYETTVDSTGLNLRQLGDQEYNIIASVQPMTKYAVMIRKPDEIKYHLMKAIFLAQNGRPGPCWIDIPLDIQGAMIEPETLQDYDPKEDSDEIPKRISGEMVQEALKMIQASKRPLIFAGTAIRHSGGMGEFRQLLESSNIPVVTAWNAHDIIENDHHLYVGRGGTIGDRAGNFAIQNCDLLLVLGSRLNIRLISYNWGNFAPNAKKIVVDIDEMELKKPTIKPDLAVLGDVREFMGLLSKQTEPVVREDWVQYCNKLKQRFDVVEPHYYNNTSKVNPYCFFREFSKKLAEHSVVVTSNGSACVISFQSFIIKNGQRLFTNSGCASMGFGLPASIGACVANKNQVYCIEGDGSLQMNVQELMTVSHNKLPIKIFVLNNGGYHSIRQTQKNFFGYPLVGVGEDSRDIAFPKLDVLAEAYSIKYFSVQTHSDFGMLDEVMNFEGPCICEVFVDEAQEFAPKVASKKLPDGKIVSSSLEDMYPFLDEEELKEYNKISI